MTMEILCSQAGSDISPNSTTCCRAAGASPSIFTWVNRWLKNNVPALIHLGQPKSVPTAFTTCPCTAGRSTASPTGSVAVVRVHPGEWGLRLSRRFWPGIGSLPAAMSTTIETTPDVAWYSVPAGDAAAQLGVHPDRGLDGTRSRSV